MSTAEQSALDRGQKARTHDNPAPEMLSELEWHQFQVEGFLTVQSPSWPERVYRVRGGLKPTEMLVYGRVALSLWLEDAKELPVEQGVVEEKRRIVENEARYLLQAKPSESLSTPRHDFLDNGLRSFDERA